MSFTFPDYEVYLSSGKRITKTEFAASSLEYQGAYGQAGVFNLRIIGEQALELEDSGVLAEGVIMLEVRAGYRDDEMVLIGRNLLIWETQFQNGNDGTELTVTAYGCSQYLRQSGQRTERLAAKTYGDAAKELAARWGLKIRIGLDSYRTISQTSAVQKTLDVNNLPDVSASVANLEQASGLENTQVLGAALRVANGQRISSLTNDTLSETGWCAQLVRQVVEYGLGIPTNSWPVAVEASRVNAALNLDGDRRARSATEYGQAAMNLGFSYGGPPQPGDILVQPYTTATGQQYGHTAIYLGLFAGVPSVLENVQVNRGTAPFGSGPIRVTPLSQWGAISVIYRARKPKADATLSGTDGAGTASKPNVLAGLIGSGVTATSKSNPVAQGSGKPRKVVLQENESDFDFLTKLGKEIGFIVSENDTGDELYFGPGIESGARDRYLLVCGQYSSGGQLQPANVSSFDAKRSIYGIPAEIIVTGFDASGRFSLVIGPEDLADRHKHQVEQNAKPAATAPKKDVLGGILGSGVTATSKANVGGAAKTPKGKTISVGARNYASSQVSELLKGAYPFVKRRVLGGASSRTDALERGLEALALEQIRFQEVNISIFGIPQIKPGHEVVLQGSEVPATLKGLYLVRSVGGNLEGQNGFEMKLMLNRNTSARAT